MAAPTVTRGRVTVISTGITKTFQFNPTEVSDSKEVNWGRLDIPGASHPVYQYGTGGERAVTFELYLDGDRARFDRPDANEDISVESEIKFWRSLVYPVKYNDTFEAVYPHLLLFSFGQYIDNMKCIMRAAPTVRVTYMNPKLQPVRATVQITFAEIVDKSQTSEDIYPVVTIGKAPIQLDPVYITANLKGNGGSRLQVGAISRIKKLQTINIEGRVPTNSAVGGNLNVQIGDAIITKNMQVLDPIEIVGFQQLEGRKGAFVAKGGHFGGAGSTGDVYEVDGSGFALKAAPFQSLAPAERPTFQSNMIGLAQAAGTLDAKPKMQTLPATTITSGKASTKTTLAPVTVTAKPIQTLPPTTFQAPPTKKAPAFSSASTLGRSQDAFAQMDAAVKALLPGTKNQLTYSRYTRKR